MMPVLQRIILALFLLIFVGVMPLTGCGSSSPANVDATTIFTVYNTSYAGPFYVNAITGSDSNIGTSSSPFRTITKALNKSAARGGGTIYVAPGIYNAVNGEVFPLVLSNNVNLIGDIPNRGIGIVPTKIEGNGSAGGSYILATGGIKGGFSRKATVLIPAGVTGVSVRGFDIGGAFDYDILVDKATATINSNTTTIMFSGLGNDMGVFNQSNVIISNNVFSDDSWYAHLEILDNTIANLRNNIFAAAVWNDGIVVQGQGTSPTSPMVDIGTSASPGGNTILGVVGLIAFNMSQTSMINVSGNTWKPNIQGADALGHYAVGTLIAASTVNYVAGNNYSVINMVGASPTIQFYGSNTVIEKPKRIK